MLYISFFSSNSVFPDGNLNEVEEPSIEEHEQQQVNSLNAEDNTTKPENLQQPSSQAESPIDDGPEDSSNDVYDPKVGEI